MATANNAPTQREVDWYAACFSGLVDNMAGAIMGAYETLRRVVLCLVAEGHVLIEDVPGVGKTSIARALAASLDLKWQRVQFTPDLLPSDVTGVSIFNQQSHEFEFREGPVFANLLVGDEINRASPKTQSALLEVMEERRVTVDGQPHAVPRPFMVIATQNPVEMDGTYRLPEAQLDRFLMRVSVGYPDAEGEAAIIRSQRRGAAEDRLSAVAGRDHVEKMIAVASRVHVATAIENYIVGVSAATRVHPDVRLGVSPRGSLSLARAAAAHAAANGRSFVAPEDVKALAVPVLAHRLILRPEALVHGRTPEQAVEGALADVPVPHSTGTP